MTDLPDRQPATTEARIVTPDPKRMADALCACYAEHEIEAEPMGASVRRLAYRGHAVMLGEEATGLVVTLESPTQDSLVAIREGFARFLSQVDAEAVNQLSWSGGLAEGLPPGFREVTLLGARLIAPSLMRMTFSGGDLAPFTRDGLHVRLMVPTIEGRAPVWPTMQANGLIRWPDGDDRLTVRVYTVRDVRPEKGELDIDVVVHQGGAFSDWAMQARPGARIGMTGPGGGFLPDTEDWLLLGGDLTALPALCRILEMMPESARGHAVLTVPDRVEEPLFLHRPEGIRVDLVSERDDPERLVEAMSRIAPPSDVCVSGWFGGEFAQAQSMRKHFKSGLRLSKSKQLSVAYWRKGVPQGGG